MQICGGGNKEMAGFGVLGFLVFFCCFERIFNFFSLSYKEG